MMMIVLASSQKRKIISLPLSERRPLFHDDAVVTEGPHFTLCWCTTLLLLSRESLYYTLYCIVVERGKGAARVVAAAAAFTKPRNVLFLLSFFFLFIKNIS